jgi:hypothetical protein
MTRRQAISVRRLANVLERDKGAPNARYISKAGRVADYDAYPLWTPPQRAPLFSADFSYFEGLSRRTSTRKLTGILKTGSVHHQRSMVSRSLRRQVVAVAKCASRWSPLGQIEKNSIRANLVWITFNRRPSTPSGWQADEGPRISDRRGDVSEAGRGPALPPGLRDRERNMLLPEDGTALNGKA